MKALMDHDPEVSIVPHSEAPINRTKQIIKEAWSHLQTSTGCLWEGWVKIWLNNERDGFEHHFENFEDVW